jgi:hypothetical protein
MTYRLPYKVRVTKTRKRGLLMPLRIRSKTLPSEQRLIELAPGDALVHRGMLIDSEILDAILSTDKRLLWAFVRGSEGDVMAMPFSEEQCIWILESDILREADVEV